MVCSAHITPAATRSGDLHSHLQTSTGNLPAIFWMMALSWSAALSKCGRFFWLYSEPCSLCPVGLHPNWYFLLKPKKTLSQTMVRWSEMPSSTTLPSPAMLPTPYPSYVDLLYSFPTQPQTEQASAFASLIVWSIPIFKVRQLQCGGGNISSPYAKLGATLTRFKEW